MPDALVNGRVCRNTVIFDNRDPQMIFDIPAGLDVFHIEYMIQMIDREMAEDILARLGEEETESSGIGPFRKPREKAEYVKVSAVHRAE